MRSKNFDDAPIVGGVWFFTLGFVFNCMSLAFIIEGILGISARDNETYRNCRNVIAALLFIVPYVYYKKNNKSERVIDKYSKRELESKVRVHPGIVLFFYYAISAGLLALTAMFKNSDGLFAE